MSISDIINPWGALRRERRAFALAVADYEGERALSKDALRASQQRAEALETDMVEAKKQLLACRLRNQKLTEKLGSAHFRNPATGRLGRKGETFEFIRPKGERFE